jgi:hypothetical protein
MLLYRGYHVLTVTDKYLQQQNLANSQNIGALQNIDEYSKYWPLMKILAAA